MISKLLTWAVLLSAMIAGASAALLWAKGQPQAALWASQASAAELLLFCARRELQAKREREQLVEVFT